jgi:hypothetical protein
VDLDRVGSYSFHYECYNKRGMAARMVTRTIVVYGDARRRLQRHACAHARRRLAGGRGS